MLAACVTLASREDEFVLVVCPLAVRAHLEKQRKEQQKQQHQQLKALRDRTEPEVTGSEPGGGGSGDAPRQATDAGKRAATFEVQPAITSVQARAVGGFNGGYDRNEDVLFEQRASDRLFVAQRRLAGPRASGKGDLYKICIYDAPLSATLHSYMLVATPVTATPFAAAGLPAAFLADSNPGTPTELHEHRTYTLKIDDHMLDDFFWDTNLLEPSRQEELLSYIACNIHLDEDREGRQRLSLRKKKLRTHQIPEAMAQIHETGGRTPAALARADPAVVSARGGCFREVGGSNTHMHLRADTAAAAAGAATAAGARKAARGVQLQGPSIRGTGLGGVAHRSLCQQGFQRITSMARRFGSTTCIVTVSKLDLTYKLSVYEPEDRKSVV